jgi:hypothetical protein
VLGIAVLGSVLQGRIAVHLGDELANTNLSPAVQDQVVTYAKQSQFELIQGIVPADQLALVFSDVQNAFVDAAHNTFTISALVCFIAAGLGLMIRNVVAVRPATAGAPAKGQNEQPAAVVAD